MQYQRKELEKIIQIIPNTQNREISI